MLPLGREVGKSCDIRLPRLDSRIVLLRILVIVVILVAQTRKTVPELVHYHRTEIRIVGGGESVGIVDPAPTIGFGICKYDDMLVRQSRKQVVQFEKVQSSKVALSVEGVERSAHCSLLPYPFGRYAHSAMLGCGSHRNEIEMPAKRPERLV